MQRKQTFLFLMYYVDFQIIYKNKLSSNRVAEFFDHQCLWSKTTSVDILHRDKYQRKNYLRILILAGYG